MPNGSRCHLILSRAAALALVPIALGAASGRDSLTYPQRTIDDAALSDERNGANWAAYGRTYDEGHYSPLTDINDANVSKLRLAWSFDLPPMASVYTAPLAVNGVLYFAVGYSRTYALDARTGKLLWEYDPKAAVAAGQKLRGGWGIRGIAYWENKVYVATHDGRLIALDARTGKPVWTAVTVEGPNDGRYITGAPRVFDGKVIIGHAGADENPVRGYVTAYDAKTGRQAWRFYAVPGNPAEGFENTAMEMAAKTWSGEWWRFGGTGGTAWNAMTYDPKYHVIYVGTGNGAPWNQQIRSPGGGDNLFLSSVVALDADTGAYRWHHQFNPGETWDYNAAMDMQLATVNIDGRERDVLMTAPKDGFFYVLDRQSGKLISAEKWAEIVNWAERIDIKTGRPVEHPDARFPDSRGFLMFPGGSLGAHSSQPMAYSPKTGFAYIPETIKGEYYIRDREPSSQWRYTPGFRVNTGIGPKPADINVPPSRSALVAWDWVRAKRAWTIPMSGPIQGGVAATAGNLVIQGRADGNLVISHAESGRELWRFFAQAGIVGSPITYRVGKTQYVTVIAGWGGAAGVYNSEHGFEYYSQPRRVLTFSLNGRAQLPPFKRHAKQFQLDSGFVVSAEKADRGRQLYGPRCTGCHGIDLNAGGTAPDLREANSATSFEALSAIVRDGGLIQNGMPRFEEFSSQDVEDLQHYIRERARGAAAKQEAAGH